MNCPVCNTTLQMADRQGIEIDYCPQCRGVWLDRGELDKIIERSAAQDPPFDAPGYRDKGAPGREQYPRHGEYQKHSGHKKKSFWREVFDFD